MRLSIPGHDVFRIGGDGGLLPSPILLPPISTEPHPCIPEDTISKRSILGLEEGILLTPGERADIVFTPRGDAVQIELHDFLRGRHAVFLTEDPDTRYPPLPECPTTAARTDDGGFAPQQETLDGPVINHIPPPPGALYSLDFDPTDGLAPPQTMLTLDVKPPKGNQTAPPG